MLMFGALAEVARREDAVDVDTPATVADVVDAIRARYPAASPVVDRCRVAVNLEIVDASCAVSPADEVAIMPPMSGGTVWVRLSAEPSVVDAMRAVTSDAAGATVTFTGTVRDACELGPVERLVYSAYDAMATKVLEAIATEAIAKWSLDAVAIDHAVGDRPAGTITFVVACAAARRDEAFEATRYVTDEVKRRAPIWKKEIGPWGARWVGL